MSAQCQHIDAPYMVTRGLPRGSDVTVCPCCGLHGDAPAGDDLAGLTCPYCHVQAVWRTDVAATPVTRQQIGTAEVLRLRIYDAPGGGEVAVQRGVYPLVREPDGTIRWLMRGKRCHLQTPAVAALGDGMFSVTGGGDKVHGRRQIEVPSKAFTPAEFEEFVASDPVAHEGGAAQRLRFALWRTDVAAGAGVGEAPAPAVAQS